MSSGIDNLFKEIVQFEERANEHREQLQEAKQKLQQRQNELKEIMEENECLAGCLVVKTENLSAHQTELLCFDIKESIMIEQLKKLVDEKDAISMNIALEEQERATLHDSFSQLASRFTAQHGLLSDCGWLSRQRKCQDRAAQLRHEIDLLTSSIRKTKSNLRRLDALSETVQVKRLQKKEIRKRLEDIKLQLASEESKLTTILDSQISDLEASPHTAPEFKRLRFEISRMQRAEADAKGEKLRWSQHERERERQHHQNPCLRKRQRVGECGGSNGDDSYGSLSDDF